LCAAIQDLQDGGGIAFDAVSREIERLAGVGEEAGEAAQAVMFALNDLNNIDLGSAQAQLLRVADGIGGFDEQIAAVRAATDDESRTEALSILANRMFELVDVAGAFRKIAPEGLRDMVREGADAQAVIDRIGEILRGNLGLTEDTADAAGTIDYSEAAASASAMAGELERAGKALAALQGGLSALEFENVGLEAEIAALEAGASEAEARLAGIMARSRAEITPILSADRGGVQGRAAEANEAQARAVLEALDAQEAALERRLSNQERRAALIERLTPDRGGTGARGIADEFSLASDVVDEFGQRFGGTFDFATRAIEEWRAETLAHLEAAGLGHTELADMVDAIARDRLAEAYREDLRNRDDWAAGVERGLDDIFGTQVTMAEIAEETVKTTFSGMEDAFVSLATTGKIETADMVDFVLRQLFRLGAAAAAGNLSSAGGGIFGNLFGGLFNGLFSGPAPGSTASILNEGGIAGRDGVQRPVNPAVCAGARRLHVGGLAGNEVPAILEDDERVMTLAQQQATAATIRGLAQLAAAPRTQAATGAGAGAGGGLNLNVNVIGAEQSPRVESRQNGDGFDIDIIFNDFEGRLGRNIAKGRGLAPVIGQRFSLRGGV